MKTRNDVDAAVSAALRQEIQPDRGQCYPHALMGAQYLGGDSLYCEGFVIVSMPSMGNGFTTVLSLLAHGWCEEDGKIIDLEGAALCYFESSRRPAERLELKDVPLFNHDKQAARRHQRQMKAALDHMVSLSPSWSAIAVYGNKIPIA